MGVRYREPNRPRPNAQTPTRSKVARLRTFKELIDIHVADMKEVGNAPGRSKAAILAMLSRRLGNKKIPELDRELFVTIGRGRAAEGAGPGTLSMDLGVIRLVLQHANAVHGLSVSTEPVDLARYALKRLGLVGKSDERDRRPTEEELTKLIAYFDGNPR